ncbi:substrate-binding domain-containing protein [Streptomyces flavotricini]|uniref:Substrate-binding domain-containing protein n=1 Tax=Streptomyces flavotricini TaxID=66888 RepID=A0ABS8EHV5_9ACTN|nr:substrate-binding domain-containing protein [Streptomyces flavotricini]
MSRPVGTAAAFAIAATALLGGCDGSVHSSPPRPGCPVALAKAAGTVKLAAQNSNSAWHGPTSGPKIQPGRSIAFVAETLSNPGVATVAESVKEAGRVAGWNVRVIDGHGTAAGLLAAFGEAIAAKPSGIVVSAFYTNLNEAQIRKANSAGITLVGWHAVGTPGPSENPKLFTNITTKVEDVAEVSADWIISHSHGNAGVVVFTDSSIPFAKHKTDLILKELAACPGVKLLSTEDIPISDAGTRTAREVSTLLSQHGDKWTHSVAINDLYFAYAAPTLRAAGKEGDGEPANIGAGDGDRSAFKRINDKQYQAATVPEPLMQQGWQIVDEFNRAFAGQPPSGYVPAVHISTATNSQNTTNWDPPHFKEEYRKIWGR